MDIFGTEFRLPEESTSQQPETGKSYIMSFLNKLEGYKTRIKNMHWAARSLPYNEHEAVHVKLDEILDLVSDYQDTIAENYMGTFDHLPMGFLSGIQPESSDPIEVIASLRGVLEGFHSRYKDNMQYIGMINATEDLLMNLPIKKYLIDLTK